MQRCPDVRRTILARYLTGLQQGSCDLLVVPTSCAGSFFTSHARASARSEAPDNTGRPSWASRRIASRFSRTRSSSTWSRRSCSASSASHRPRTVRRSPAAPRLASDRPPAALSQDHPTSCTNVNTVPATDVVRCVAKPGAPYGGILSMGLPVLLGCREECSDGLRGGHHVHSPGVHRQSRRRWDGRPVRVGLLRSTGWSTTTRRLVPAKSPARCRLPPRTSASPSSTPSSRSRSESSSGSKPKGGSHARTDGRSHVFGVASAIRDVQSAPGGGFLG